MGIDSDWEEKLSTSPSCSLSGKKTTWKTEKSEGVRATYGLGRWAGRGADWAAGEKERWAARAREKKNMAWFTGVRVFF
jgi:hypothetical protein